MGILAGWKLLSGSSPRRPDSPAIGLVASQVSRYVPGSAVLRWRVGGGHRPIRGPACFQHSSPLSPPGSWAGALITDAVTRSGIRGNGGVGGIEREGIPGEESVNEIA